jgi:energy-coupling factor transporter ATP-binding protein EcfA2
MQIEPKQILVQFESITKTALQTTFLSWYEYHQEKINELQAILDPLKIHLVQTEEWVYTPEEFWHEIEEINRRIIKWTTSLHYLSSDLELEQLIKTWSEQFDLIEKNLPDEIRILIGNTLWQRQPDDSLSIRLRKRYNKSKRWLQLKLLNLHNLGRRIAGKAPLRPEDVQHHIPLHNFLYYFLGLPLKQFLLAEWQRLLQAVSGQYFVMQMKNAELNNKILLLDKFPAIYNLGEKVNIFDELYELAEILKSVDETLQVLIGYNKQFRVRLDKILAEVTARFQSAWNDARTFQINDKKYAEKRIRKINQQLKLQFQQAVSLWYEHFRGLRQDWQKSLQLALLQFQSAHALRKMARVIDGKVRNTVDPLFSEITALMQEMESRFTGLTSSRDLEKLIKREEELTLKTGIQPKLAVLIDTIHHVQLITDLESFSREISADLDHVDMNYNIFLKRDTENSPPHSRLAEIPLRNIIRKYILANLVSANQSTILHTGDRLEKTIRSISEIDQILDHAFDTASNLIFQQGYELNVQEPQTIIQDAFARIKKILIKLKQDMDAMPQQATTALVDDLLKFENYLHNLSDIKKILELKKRLTRELKPSWFKKHLGKVSASIFHPFPKIRKKVFPSALSPAVHKKPFNLDQPVQLPIETIGSFLKQTNLQIAHLPFVYQRLFLLEPLTNLRFFYGREKEIATIRQEYINWKNGKATCLVIIGETGSGKTSLLNQVENKIFNSHPLTKLDLQEKLYAESKLTDFLKKRFNYPNASTLTEIEIRIMHETENRICILENLHHAFLRVVNGLDALEKLLLLITRTQQKIFWIITCNRHAWHYLDKVLNISKNFSQILSLERIPVDEMKSILIKRHRVSGYELDFEIPKSWSQNRKFKKYFGRHPAKQKVLQEFFFAELNELSAGNLTIAILHWLRAIHKFSADKLILTPYVTFDYSFLNDLQEEDLFTLASILNHETLTAADHALIFRQIPENSSIQMARLQNYGLIVPNGSGFQVNPFLYRPLAQLLSAKNVSQ